LNHQDTLLLEILQQKQKQRRQQQIKGDNNAVQYFCDSMCDASIINKQNCRYKLGALFPTQHT